MMRLNAAPCVDCISFTGRSNQDEMQQSRCNPEESDRTADPHFGHHFGVSHFGNWLSSDPKILT
jgi:hypothetical protein